MPQLTSRTFRIETILKDIFAPKVLEITDNSAAHAGHAGAAPGGETHYKVRITSEKFAGKTRVEMQRAIMDALEEEFATGLHALSISASAV